VTEPSDVPRRVGRYEPVIALGAGGMATVYLARAPLAHGVSRLVALKLVHPHLRGSEEAASTLIEEAKLAARIRHPNVVPVHEVGEDAAGIFLVMDYVEGATLAALLRAVERRGEPLPLPIAGRIVIDALAGLHAAHELKSAEGAPLELVHRDFSPVNVLVGADGVTRLTDFGIAKAASRHGATSTGVVKGKVGYLSPEQALGKPLDRRSDVWAAGVVIWELLAGRRLYAAGDEQVATMLRIVSETPPRLQAIRPELPDVVDQAVAMALTLDVNRRWPSARELADALALGWRSHGGPAEQEEVGAYVRSVMEEELAARRALLRAAAPAPIRKRRGLPLALASAALVAAGIGAFALGATGSSGSAPAPTPAEPAAPAPSEPAAAAAVLPSASSASDAGLAVEAPATPVRAPRARKKSERLPALGPNPYRKP
jgi:eukaryotic-like serine/threonine-protein kinase